MGGCGGLNSSKFRHKRFRRCNSWPEINCNNITSVYWVSLLPETVNIQTNCNRRCVNNIIVNSKLGKILSRRAIFIRR